MAPTDSDKDTAQIPIISLCSSNAHAADQLLDAASTHGFVFIDNDDEYGIPPSAIEHMFTLSKTFFASPLQDKQAVAMASNRAGKNHGWLGRGVEKLDPHYQPNPDVKEAFNMCIPLEAPPDPPLPASLHPHLACIRAFHASCHALCQTILTHLALALGLDRDWFTQRHDPSRGPTGTIFRMLYYPSAGGPAPDPATDVRAGAHADYGSITLLFRQPGQAGLEIRTRDGGGWAAVPVDPRGDAGEGRVPVLVNIGDLLQDWTAGLLRSTVHRVVFPPRGWDGRRPGERYSMAYFCHPLDEVELVPVPSEAVRRQASSVGSGLERGGKILTARDHLMNRLAASCTV